MILDSIQNIGLYESIHPRFQKAFSFLTQTNLSLLPPGKYELDGTNLFVNVVEATGKTAETALLETHNLYIDIQVPVEADETFGWKVAKDLKDIKAPYNIEKDITFFTDKATNYIKVQPNEFVVFFPEDGHQPCIFEGKQKKIIVKVLV